MYPSLSFFFFPFWPIQLIISMGSLYFCYTTPSCNCTHPLGSWWSLLFLTGPGFYNRSNKFHVNVFKETDNVILLSPTGFAASQRTLNHLIKGHTVKNCSVEARSKDFGAQSVIKSGILKSYICSNILPKIDFCNQAQRNGKSVSTQGQWGHFYSSTLIFC